jgi:hypothetical protein
MTLWRCPRCRRVGEPTDARLYDNRATRDEPGYDEDACKRCAPSEHDLDALRDAETDRRIDEARASDGPDGFPYAE